MALATLAAIAGNLLLIPVAGEIGAAWATVVAEAVLLLGTYAGVRRYARQRLDEPTGQPSHEPTGTD